MVADPPQTQKIQVVIGRKSGEPEGGKDVLLEIMVKFRLGLKIVISRCSPSYNLLCNGPILFCVVLIYQISKWFFTLKTSSSFWGLEGD